MDHFIRVWGLLVVATIGAVLIDLEWRSGGLAATAGILAIAALKIRFVALDYMELRHAPVALRVAFEGWLYTITLAIFAMMAFGPAVFAQS